MCNKQITVMKKFFRMVTALSLVAGVLAFTGCTDYEDDINALDERLTAVESTVSELQSAIDGGAVITNVESTADGITITLSNGKTYDVTNGKDGATGADGKPGSVVTIGENGNWLIDGVDTGKPSRGEKGETGEAGETGPAGTDASTIYYEPNANGNWDKVTISPDGEKTVEPTEESWKAAGITAAWDTEKGTLTFTNVEGAENGTIVISLYPGRLTSITLIPEVYYDGVPAIEINSYEYIPKTVTSNSDAESFVNTPGAKKQTTSKATKDVRYHVSPSTVTIDGIGDPTYLIETAKMINTKAGSDPVLEVVTAKIEDEELIVTVKKAAGVNLQENPKGEDYIYTAALEVPVTKLYNGEDPFSVYSEYSALIESSVEPHIAALVDDNDHVKDEYICDDAHSHFYSTYVDAQNAAKPCETAYFAEPLDLLTMVTGCYTDAKGDAHEITKAALEEAGLEFVFYVPTKSYNVGDNDTDQQKFAKIDGTELIAVTPEGLTANRATIGKTPVIRAELVDVNNNDYIVDVVYFKIQWVDKPLVPEDEDLGNIADFSYILSCADFEESVNWETMVNEILAKVNDGNGLSYEEFVARYMESDVTATYKSATNATLVGKSASVTASWEDSYEPTAAAFTWTMTPADFGDLFTKYVQVIKENDEIGEFTVNVELESSMPGEGTLSFQFTVKVICPELPSIEDYAPGYWDEEGSLLRVYPLQITDKYWDGQTKGNYTVEYNYPFLEQFIDVNKDGIFLTNIVPTAEQIAAATKENRDIEEEWQCRKWDVQYSATQKYAVGYAPQFATGDLFAGENDATGYHLYKGLNDAAHIWWTKPNEDAPENTPYNWYVDDVAKIELRLPYIDGGDNSAAIGLLNENRLVSEAVADYNAGKLKTVAIDIWSRINAYNVYKVQTVNVWFVNPLTIDAEVKGEFTDAIYGGSKVSIADAFDSVKDFLGNTVNVYTGGSGSAEDLRVYYDVQTPAWKVDEALISINKNTNDIDNDLDPNNAADKALMSKLQDRYTQASVRLEGDDLVFYNEGGAAVTEVMYIWVPVSVEHKWGVWEYFVPIKVNPNPNTSK